MNKGKKTTKTTETSIEKVRALARSREKFSSALPGSLCFFEEDSARHQHSKTEPGARSSGRVAWEVGEPSRFVLSSSLSFVLLAWATAQGPAEPLIAAPLLKHLLLSPYLDPLRPRRELWRHFLVARSWKTSRMEWHEEAWQEDCLSRSGAEEGAGHSLSTRNRSHG